MTEQLYYHTILVPLDGNLTEDINWLTALAADQGWYLGWMTSTHQGVLLTFTQMVDHTA